MADRTALNICFHGIGEPKRELEPGEAPYWITVDTFKGILDLVVDRPEVHLSFDDGNVSDLEYGLPALTERGLSGTFFVLAGRMELAGSLDADHVRALQGNGMVIGTHGMDHRPWPGLTRQEWDRELVEARAILADVAGVTIDEAAMPLGRYNRALLGELRRLRYSTVYSSDRRAARSGSWLQPRFSVRRDDTLDSVRATMLTPMPMAQRAKLSAIGLVKRLR